MDARGRADRPQSDAAAAAVAPASPDVAAAMAAVDWEATAVGPRATWPAPLRTMVDAVLGSRFSMWLGWGPELTFFYNDAYGHGTLGVKHPWALGRPAPEVWAEIWAEVGPRIEQVLVTGEATWDEDLLLFLERSGFPEETYHTFSYSPLFDAGHAAGVLCVVSEETDRVIGERRMTTLRELSSRFAATTTQAEVVDALTAVLDANQWDLPFTLTYLVDDHGEARLAASTGIDAGAPVSPAVVHEDRAAWPLDAMAPGEVRVVDDLDRRFPEVPCGAWSTSPTQAAVVAVSELGQEAPAGYLVVGLNPYRPLDPGYRGWIELVAGQIASAVTNARAFETERRRSEALAELDRAKTTFFTNVSHEFRTPLTLLLGPLEDLLDGPPGVVDDEVRDTLSVAHRNALRLLKLVNALLDFSRLEAGRAVATREPVDVAGETADVAGMFRSAIEAAGVELVVDCPTLDQPVLLDRRMWELILTNLLSNAFKHTFAGTIAVRLRAIDEELVLEVADTGVGIPPDEMGQLFHRFHRVEGAPSRSHEGSGIGLSLVQELAGLHGGAVTAESEVGRGTTFRVCVPLVPAPRPDLEPAADQPARSSTLKAHVTEVTMWARADGAGADEGADRHPTGPAGAPDGEGRPRVLVVDDNADMRDYVARLLADRYGVVTAVDGLDALEKAEAVRPDLVVSDVMMPRVDGLELVRRLRAMPDLADLPVVLLSARAGADSSVEGLDVGADDYLVKPFAADELLGRVGARLSAGVERRRDRVLAALADELGDVDDEQALVDAVQHLTAELLGHERTVVGATAGDLLQLHFAPAPPQAIHERYHVIDRESANPMAVAARDGITFAVASLEAFTRIRPELADDHLASGAEAMVVVPLPDGLGAVAGALGVTWSRPRTVDADTVATVEAIGALAGRTVERLRVRRWEQRVAEEIQGQLLEVDLRSTMGVVAARYQPADPSLVVGGDWYDAISLDDHRVGLAVGDVVGTGLPAALVMGQLRSALGAAAVTQPDPAAVIAMVDAFAERLAGASCTTAIYCVIEDRDDAAGSVLRWCAAGHPPVVVATDSGTRLEWGGRRPPLGIGVPGECTDDAVELDPASLVLLYTDGLVERRGEPLDTGLERLRRAVDDHAHLLTGELCDRVLAELAPGDATDDDVALVALRTPGRSPRRFVDAVVADPGELAGTRTRLREWLDTLDLTPDDAQRILLAVGEATANAVEHGSPGLQGSVGIELGVGPDGLCAAVTDTGRWDRDASRSAQLGRGRGLRIMEALTDELTVRRTPLGSTVTLRFAVLRPDR
jgi:signal transduction histidine kinase/DNA-binding response OmpR family regulator/serine phosphatase RsbU (regulator of sigma subunit)